VPPTYRTKCPIDGFELLPVALDSTVPPWFCMRCRHSWWVTQLSEDARKQFRPAVEDFGYGPELEALEALVATEKQEAETRGTSCREDQIELLQAPTLRWMALDPKIHEDFKASVKPELARKGG
jgi:hypothetical protein